MNDTPTAVGDHPVTEYGTTRCPVERVAAEIDTDDGTCSACGAVVTPPDLTPEQRLLRAIFGSQEGPEHQLIGAACTCGDWSAQCGNDVPEQWRQHVNAAEAAKGARP